MRYIKYFLWYLFFSAYWTAYNLGEKIRPESNATNFIMFAIGLNLFALFEMALLFGYKFSGIILFLFCVLPAVLIPYLLFTQNKVFKSKIEQFRFLNTREYNRKRYILLISITVETGLLVFGLALVRNILGTS